MHFGFIRTYVLATPLRQQLQYLRQWFLYRQHDVVTGHYPDLSE
jgi:hypothetical protein